MVAGHLGTVDYQAVRAPHALRQYQVEMLRDARTIQQAIAAQTQRMTTTVLG